ncbi:MAG: O-linked N-acetylglucosamine transferase, SPINDLY family protein [Planctomycetota bacterium]|jgi:predicted O-linked N-acetylglucosamine transferase (SPINDLY family)
MTQAQTNNLYHNFSIDPPFAQSLSNTADPHQALNLANLAIGDNNFAHAGNILTDRILENALKFTINNPDKTGLLVSIATTLYKINEFERAENLIRNILKHTQNAALYNKLGTILQYTGQLTEALEYQSKAIQLEPEQPELWANKARVLIETGKSGEGIDLLRKAVEKMPNNAQAHSNLLFRMHHLAELNLQAILEEHLKWALQHAPAERARKSHPNNPDMHRKLRIGYISPDFRTNSVAYFFESLLDGHDRTGFEVFGYGNVESPDQFTEYLMQKFDHYHNVFQLSDLKLVKLIQSHRIDILVELAGHTGNNRLTALAYKPAPIQVTYLGYPDTTGMEAIDYRFTDEACEMPNSQQFYTEQLVSLPEGFLCYKPPEFAPYITPPPCEQNGFITFGSFNNNCKFNPSLAQLWSSVLISNPGSKLLLKIKGGQYPEIQKHYIGMFQNCGISAERINIIGWKALDEHLKMYSEIDISLDTYPYHGTTTTCESLWMGVPVITLVGGQHISRVGLSILRRIGLEFFAAKSPQEFTAKATALAQNRSSLSQIRSSMRARIATSGLCHAKAFTQNIERAYRQMWHIWCNSRS